MIRRFGAFAMALVVVVGLSALAVRGSAATTGGSGGTGASVRAVGDVTAISWSLESGFCGRAAAGQAVDGYRRPDTPRIGAAVAARRPRSVAVFLGDSYTSGWRGVGEGSEGWPAILGASRHWTVHNLAVAGTGFVNPGWTGQPIGSRVDAAIGLRPGIVFVAGGHNDENLATAPVTAAADSVLNRLATALPHAVIVVIGPIWPDGNPKATLVRLRDHLHATAADLGALFIDPIGDGWFAGPNERFIGPDGTHPTSLGYRRIARLVGAALETDPRLSVSLARDVVSVPAANATGSSSAPGTTNLPALGPCPS